MDTLKNFLAAGLPVPEKVIIKPATVDDTGKVAAGLGWEFSGDLEAVVWLKFRPKSRSIADGLAGVLNGVREQVGAQDDTPGVLTLQDLGEVLFGVALGKQ